MDSRETIVKLAGSAQEAPTQLESKQGVSMSDDPIAVELLQAVKGQRQSPADLSNQLEIPRQRVYRLLEPFDEIGIVTRVDSDFSLTGAGEALLTVYQRANSVLSSEMMGYFARSQHREWLLNQIHLSPAKRNEIGKREGAPSGSTIRRALTEFETRGWIKYSENNRIQTTEAGETALMAYQKLLKSTEQIQQKEPFLRRLGPRSTELPFAALEDADLVVATPDNPHAPLNAAMDKTGLRKAVSEDAAVDRIRTVCPVFSPPMFDVFGEFVDLGTQIEIVFDAEVRQELCSKDSIHYLAGALAAPNVAVRFLSKSLTFGVGIYDSTGMVVAYTSSEGHEAGITTRSAEVNNWIRHTFDEYWNQSETPSDYVLGSVRRYFEGDIDINDTAQDG